MLWDPVELSSSQTQKHGLCVSLWVTRELRKEIYFYTVYVYIYIYMVKDQREAERGQECRGMLSMRGKVFLTLNRKEREREREGRGKRTEANKSQKSNAHRHRLKQ